MSDIQANKKCSCYSSQAKRLVVVKVLELSKSGTTGQQYCTKIRIELVQVNKPKSLTFSNTAINIVCNSPDLGVRGDSSKFKRCKSHRQHFEETQRYCIKLHLVTLGHVQ